MTEEQRRQAAAQRCAELASQAGGAPWTAADYEDGALTPNQQVAFNAILELDELARAADALCAEIHQRADRTTFPGFQRLREDARKHILPDPVVLRAREICHEYFPDIEYLKGTIDHSDFMKVAIRALREGMPK